MTAAVRASGCFVQRAISEEELSTSGSREGDVEEARARFRAALVDAGRPALSMRCLHRASRLRRKLAAPQGTRYVRNVWGVGYCLLGD